MKRFLMPCIAICLARVVATGAAPKKGDTEIEILGGLAMEKGTTATDYESFLTAGTAGADPEAWFLSGGISRFFTDSLQVGIAGLWMNMDDSQVAGWVSAGVPEFPEAGTGYQVDVELDAFGVGGRAKWHLHTKGKVKPYLGAQAFWAKASVDITGTEFATADLENEIGVISESVDVDGVLWGPIVGLSIPLSAQNTLFVEYQYHLWAGSLGDTLKDGHAGSIGFAHRLK